MQRKGSIISAIFSSYREALKLSQERYSQLYGERAVNAIEFYEDLLKDLIIRFDEFKEPSLRRQIRGTAEAFFGKDDIQFVAIDGTCKKDPFTDFMVFSSIAYGVRGEISLQGDPPTLKYKRRSMDEDVSMVAYVPVPFAEIADVANPDRLEDFVVTDQDKVDLSNIHTTLMQLAEVYLAYEMARSTTPDRPRLILMDHSPSSIMASTDVGVKRIGLASASDLDTRRIGLLGYGVGRRILDQGDAIVAYAHPFNEELGLPSTKHFRLYNALIAECVPLYQEIQADASEAVKQLASLTTRGSLSTQEEKQLMDILQRLGRLEQPEVQDFVKIFQEIRNLKKQVEDFEDQLNNLNNYLVKEFTQLLASSMVLSEETKIASKKIIDVVECSERDYRFMQVQDKMIEVVLVPIKSTLSTELVLC